MGRTNAGANGGSARTTILVGSVLDGDLLPVTDPRDLWPCGSRHRDQSADPVADDAVLLAGDVITSDGRMPCRAGPPIREVVPCRAGSRRGTGRFHRRIAAGV